MSLENLCQIKTAYLIEPDTSPNILDIVHDFSMLCSLFKQNLPDAWEFKGTDISGAAGYVLIFETVDVPCKSLFTDLVNVIDKLELDLKNKAYGI